MKKNYHSNPDLDSSSIYIDYECIVDIDIGIYNFLSKGYKKIINPVFKNIPDGHKTVMHSRMAKNPLELICIKEIDYDGLYKEIMDNHLEEIISLSPITDLFFSFRETGARIITDEKYKDMKKLDCVEYEDMSNFSDKYDFYVFKYIDDKFHKIKNKNIYLIDYFCNSIYATCVVDENRLDTISVISLYSDTLEVK